MFKRQIAPPSTYPVTLQELKDHLAISNNDSDNRLQGLIIAANDYCERWTNRVFSTQTWEYVLSEFPRVGIELPYPPLQSVVSVSYLDLNGDPQDFTDYITMTPTGSQPGWLEYTAATPSVSCRSDAVTVTFLCGSDNPPEMVKHAIKLLCGGWNELRESEILTTSKELEIGVKNILGLLQVGNYL